VNYYERHIGDYAKDAGHLSMLEHGAYTILLDRYYSTEQGIPESKAHRLCRARTDEEAQAVDMVLEEFFELVDGVWINSRAEFEIEKAQARLAAAQENGKKGGRPAKDRTEETQQKPSENPTLTQQKPNPNPDQSSPSTYLPSTYLPEDQKQTPASAASSDVDARPEKPAAVAAVRFNAAEFLIEQGADRQTAADYLTLRKGKKAASTHTALRQVANEAKRAGLDIQTAIEMCCARGWAGFKAEWVEQQAIRAGPQRQTLHEQRKATLDELTGRTRHDQQSQPRDITAEVIRTA